jgi:Bifunctional DNA primase/polymerase, N-terminal
MICVDIDPRNGVTREMFEAKVGQLPPTMTVTSGRGDGGKHLYYWRNTSALRIPFDPDNPDPNLDRLIRQWANPTFHMSRHNKTFPTGVDIKLNGYMIMPPSTHPDTGKPYTWNDEFVRLLPQALSLWLQPPGAPPKFADPRDAEEFHGPSAAALDGILRKLMTSRNGERNKLLYWAARRLVENDYPEEAFDRLAHTAEQIGLPGSEINKTINSAIRGDR